MSSFLHLLAEHRRHQLSHLTSKQRPLPPLTSTPQDHNTLTLLTKGPISPRLKDVAGSTEALDEGSNTLTAASPSPQGAQEGAQHALHH